MARSFDDDKTLSHDVLGNGTSVGHYRIVKKTGSGGMGEVYLAEDTELKRRVALKFLSPHLTNDDSCKARFRREAQAAAALDHENIVTVHEVGEYQGRPYFSMQYIEGRSLREAIKARSFDLREAVDLFVGICCGLSEAHRSGITHRDIKPSNIVIDPHGHPKLVDFGLATVSGSGALTKSGAALGTVGYMSPEMVRGEPTDARGDIFSLGVILYEMIVGLEPFRRESDAATLHAIAYESPAPVGVLCPDVPQALERILDRALEKDLESRYQTVDDMLADLKTVQGALEFGIQLPCAGTSPQFRFPWSKRMAATITAVAITVMVIVVLVSPGIRRTTLGWLGKDPVPNQRHLAVLPFTDLGEPVLGQAFGDGLMETLSSKLTQMEQFHGSLWVVPASEVRDQRVSSAGQARRRFGVNLAVSGSMQRFGDNARLTLNLVDTKSKRQLRSCVLDHSVTDLTALQDSIVAVMVDMLEVHLQPLDRRALTAGGTASPPAYSSYLQARGHLQFPKDEECLACIDSAIDLFSHAIDLDPNYALAYAGLGEAYWLKYELGRDVQWVDPAIRNSQVALGLSDRLAPVYVTLGMIHEGRGRYEDAVQYFLRALEIDSVNRVAHSELALAYESLGDINQAESTYVRAIELAPNRWRGYYDLAFAYLYRGRLEDALEQAVKAESLAPSAVSPLNDLGGLYVYLGDREKARVLLERSLELEPSYAAYSNLGAIHQLEKRPEEAAEMFERALEIDDGDYRVWINLASIYETIPNRSEKALAAYRVAIPLAEEQRSINPNNPLLLCYLADSYGAIGEREKSLALAGQAAELAPENVETMVRIGIVCEEAGLRDEGIPIAEIENYSELQDLLADPRFTTQLEEE
jgi:tetratricopeptide (TPR) repeat protein/TolB-like protein/tRNA A-37 threonylcarbamoyl transferase component Bud32